MKSYLLITSKGVETTAISILAVDVIEVFVRAYVYYGEKSFLNRSDFRILLQQRKDIGEMKKLFEDLVDEKILYLGQTENAIIDNMPWVSSSM